MSDINLTGRKMCDECDAFLGKEHHIGCSLSGEVTEEQSTEKFTTVEHAEEEEPLLGIDVTGAEMLVRWLGELDLEDPAEAEKCRAMREGLEKFLVEARGEET